MLKWFLTFLLLLASLPAWGNPALWVVHGPHATVYLFGSVHLLRPGVEWQGAALRRAFDAASECWFEIKPPDDLDKMRLLVLHSGFDYSQKLSDLLTPEEHFKLITVAEDVGIHQMRLSAMRPWLIATLLEHQILVRAGYDPALGVDAVLQEQAKAAGKDVLGLEQDESHVHMLADLPQDFAVQMLTHVLDEAEDEPVRTDGFVADRQEGNIRQWTTSSTQEPQELSHVITARRNMLFANAIKGLLMGSRTALVTIGAGHFMGPSNVRELLGARGLQIERMPD